MKRNYISKVEMNVFVVLQEALKMATKINVVKIARVEDLHASLM